MWEQDEAGAGDKTGEHTALLQLNILGALKADGLGEAADLVKSGAIDKIADLVHKLAGPLAEEVGLIMAEKVRAYRVKNMISVFKKTQKMLSDSELPESVVPPRIFLPILDASSLESDESLQDLWAGLLASASQKSDGLSPSFIETLKQLTPHQARTLNACYGLFQDVPAFVIWTEDELKRVLCQDDDSTMFTLTINAFERLGLFTRVYNLQERKDLLSYIVTMPTLSEPFITPTGDMNWSGNGPAYGRWSLICLQVTPVSPPTRPLLFQQYSRRLPVAGFHYIVWRHNVAPHSRAPCPGQQNLMYSAGGSQGLIPSTHFSGLFALQDATSAVVYND